MINPLEVSSIRGLAASRKHPDILFSIHDDGFIYKWDITTGLEIEACQSHAKELSSMALSSDGKVAVTCSRYSPLIKTWAVDCTPIKLMWETTLFDHSASLVRISGGEVFIGVIDAHVEVLSLKTGAQILCHLRDAAGPVRGLDVR